VRSHAQRKKDRSFHFFSRAQLARPDRQMAGKTDRLAISGRSGPPTYFYSPSRRKIMFMDRPTFETIADVTGSPGVPVMLEDSRMGLISHWDDDGAQIEAYRGNDHECIQVPWKNLIKTPLGIVVGLKDARRNADQ
jgi:hypothetical protein